MGHKILGLLAACLIAAPIAVRAQTETLYYQGSIMNGSVSESGYAPPAPFAFSGSIVLSSPLGANLNDATIVPTSWGFNSPLGELNSTFAAEQPDDSGATFEFTTVKGKITGWSIDLYGGIDESTNSPSYESGLIGLSGDSYSGGFSSPSCNAPPGFPTPCFAVSFANSKPGAWTASVNTPELDPASLAGGLTLLLGGLAVLCGRRVAPLAIIAPNGRSPISLP
jgi:hypothetical protein